MALTPETFIMQFFGGEYDTETFTAPPDSKWPLPDVVYALDPKTKKRLDTGRYEKTFESKGEPKDPSQARGAMYEWKEAEVNVEAL